jgi:hypothetical protein
MARTSESISTRSLLGQRRHHDIPAGPRQRAKTVFPNALQIEIIPHAAFLALHRSAPKPRTIKHR